MLDSDFIIYEQPLYEHLRVCLRLEHLFEKIILSLNRDSLWDSRVAMSAMLEILNILERPDFKSKLIKALNQHAQQLTNLENTPEVDTKKLKDCLVEIDRLLDGLNGNTFKLGQSLRDNEFLNNIRMHNYRPAGAVSFNCPGYNFWLHQPTEQRQKLMINWLQQLELVKNTVYLLLQLTRESSELNVKFAAMGFYQENLNPLTPYQIIRVAVPSDRKVYPEISIGKHRLSIHFYLPNFDGKSVRATHDIPFKLAYCVF